VRSLASATISMSNSPSINVRRLLRTCAGCCASSRDRPPAQHGSSVRGCRWFLPGGRGLGLIDRRHRVSRCRCVSQSRPRPAPSHVRRRAQ
jgi:hypothetical protein